MGNKLYEVTFVTHDGEHEYWSAEYVLAPSNEAVTEYAKTVLVEYFGEDEGDTTVAGDGMSCESYDGRSADFFIQEEVYGIKATVVHEEGWEIEEVRIKP